MTEVDIALATLEPSWVRCWWLLTDQTLQVAPNRSEAYFTLMSFALMSLLANVTKPKFKILLPRLFIPGPKVSKEVFHTPVGQKLREEIDFLETGRF